MNLSLSVFCSDLRSPGNEYCYWKWALFSALQLASFLPLSLPRAEERRKVFHQSEGTIVCIERTRSIAYGAGAFEVIVSSEAPHRTKHKDREIELASSTGHEAIDTEKGVKSQCVTVLIVRDPLTGTRVERRWEWPTATPTGVANMMCAFFLFNPVNKKNAVDWRQRKQPLWRISGLQDGGALAIRGQAGTRCVSNGI